MSLKTQVQVGPQMGPKGSKGSTESESNLCCHLVHQNMGLQTLGPQVGPQARGLRTHLTGSNHVQKGLNEIQFV